MQIKTAINLFEENESTKCPFKFFSEQYLFLALLSLWLACVGANIH